jgi:hypothetical protein
MRNTSNKSLNDLFRSAEAEVDGNVLSQSEVERLLQTGKRSVPVTQSIQQKLFERLLSTPLKIGMTAMTTAACITLGLIAFWPQQSTTTVTKNPILSHRTYGSQGMDGATQNISQPTTNYTPSANFKSQPSEAIIKIPTQPIATADSLQPVELSPEQLAQLGIVLEDNGDIAFYTRDVSSAKDSNGDSLVYANHYSLPPTWGLRIHFLAHGLLTPRDVPEIHCLSMMPKLITEPNGAKRLFSFEADVPSKFKNGNFHTKEIKNFTNENGKMDVMPVFDDDTEMQNVVSKSLNPGEIRTTTVHDSGNGVSHPMVLSVYGNSPGQIQIGENSSIPQGQSVVTINGMSNSTPNGSINVGVRLGQSTNIIINDDTSGISTLTKAMVNLKSDSSLILLDTENTSTPYKVLINNGSSQLPDDAITTTIKHFNPGGTEVHFDQNVPADSINYRLMNITLNHLNCNMNIKPNDIDSEYNSFVEDPTEFDRLIPIRVINSKNAAHPNELIFWYEPTPELTAAMPAAVSPVPAVQSKQLAISVYPNPTYAPATVHYELSDAPRAYFSVRNLLGQEVLNGGMTSGAIGDANLDLSQLPAGVYLLITTTDNGERDVERVVVTK